MIRRLKSGEYGLYSRKKNLKTGKRRSLGTFRTREGAEKHERAVQFFKRGGQSNCTMILCNELAIRRSTVLGSDAILRCRRSEDSSGHALLLRHGPRVGICRGCDQENGRGRNRHRCVYKLPANPAPAGCRSPKGIGTRTGIALVRRNFERIGK